MWGNHADYQHAGERGKMMMMGMQHDVNEYAEHLMENELFRLPKYKDRSLEHAVKLVRDAPTRVACVGNHPDALNIVRHAFENNKYYAEFIPKPNLKPQNISRLQGKTSVKVLCAQALPGVGRHHPDFVPLSVASAVLGYGFGGMLMKRVRMADGLTYGISSHLEPGRFQISASFPPRNLERGKQDIQQVLAQWRGNITQKEVDNQIRRINLMPTTLSDRADMFCRAQHTFLDEQEVRNCTLDQVLDAFDRHIDIHNLVQVEVG